MIGILLVLVIQGPFSTGSDCKNLNETAVLNGEIIKDESFWANEKYVLFAFIITFIFVLGNVLLILFVEEKNSKLKYHADYYLILFKTCISSVITEKTDQANVKGKISVLKECKQIFTFKPFLILVGAFVFNQLAIQVYLLQ